MPPDPEPPDLTPPPVPSVEAAVVTDQVAAPVSEPPAAPAPGHHTPHHTHCENCATELQGPFCHRCGQHDFDFNQGFGHALHEALESFFHFDAKLFRNTVTLLFRPGRLSAEFNAGHRAAQMPPLRFYVFVSILFFFVSFAGRHTPADAALPYAAQAQLRTEIAEATAELRQDPNNGQKAARLKQLNDRLEASLIRFDDEEPEISPAPPPNPAAAAATTPKSPRPVQPKSDFERTLEEKGSYAMAHQHEIAETFLHAIPKMLLVCLPFFALYMRILFRKAGLAYLQHLVVAVHFHTFIFLWLMFRNGWAGLADLASHTLHNWIVLACNVWMVLYPLFMLRRLYANPWKRTLVKTLALTLAYFFTLAGVFVATAVIIFASL